MTSEATTVSAADDREQDEQAAQRRDEAGLLAGSAGVGVASATLRASSRSSVIGQRSSG